MSQGVITASPETPLREIARLLEKNRIKRVPIVENGQLVGIVSRANLIQAVAAARHDMEMPLSDQHIRERLTANLQDQSWAQLGLINITVTNGIVGLWGIVDSDTERKALKVAAESVPGVVEIEDHLIMRPFEA
jgi:CBS domain-containing protein